MLACHGPQSSHASATSGPLRCQAQRGKLRELLPHLRDARNILHLLVGQRLALLLLPLQRLKVLELLLQPRLQVLVRTTGGTLGGAMGRLARCGGALGGPRLAGAEAEALRQRDQDRRDVAGVVDAGVVPADERQAQGAEHVGHASPLVPRRLQEGHLDVAPAAEGRRDLQALPLALLGQHRLQVPVAAGHRQRGVGVAADVGCQPLGKVEEDAI
mmetsp:Transcript_17441/g.52425  ORF Transcript_17441/g.52425 Transcript_17441/m.52425 type:complete len:215 (-) Transcript_17441:320-964(-)